MADQEHNEEISKINGFFKSQTKEIVLILKGHLILENHLDQILNKYLKNGKVLSEKNFSFYIKLQLVRSIGILPDHIIKSIEGVNTVRNKFSHILSYELSQSSIDLIGKPLGKYYTELKINTKKNLLKLSPDSKFFRYVLLTSIVYYLFGFLEAFTEKIPSHK